MPSQYDSITTAADLVLEVRAHGLSTLTDDIVRAQDILGHSTVEEIAFLAEGGEKDCFGNAKHDYIQRTLFQIVFSCWDRDRAVALYNEHVTRYPQQLKDAQQELRTEKAAHMDTTLQRNTLRAERDSMSGTCAKLQKSVEELCDERDALKLEILALKAKLYDQMTAGA